MLETERLILRPFTPGDAGAMFRNWASDPEVTEFLKWPPHNSIDISQQILTEWVASYAKPDYYLWAVTLRPLDEPIGSISVIGRNEETSAVSIGYCIGKAWWRQGITTEALKRLVVFFIEEVSVNRLDSWHDPRNPNSGQVMMKAGLKYEGTRRRADWNNKGICDIAGYAILKEDYDAVNRADGQVLLHNLDQLHTTEMGVERIKRNLGLPTDDVVAWCQAKITEADKITRGGKNWYITVGETVITVNAHSYTIITAHWNS